MSVRERVGVVCQFCVGAVEIDDVKNGVRLRVIDKNGFSHSVLLSLAEGTHIATQLERAVKRVRTQEQTT
jgi:hypothetical protein